jgi:hypothetical protein
LASDTPVVANKFIPKTVNPLVKLELLAKAAVTKFDELSPTLPTAVYETEQLVEEVDVVDVVVEVVESSDFLQPRMRNNGSEKTSIILSNFIFSSSGNC